MQELEIELGVGDAIRIGNCLFTVIDVEEGEVCVRLEAADDPALTLPAGRPPGK